MGWGEGKEGEHDGAEVIAIPKEDRFTTRFTSGVLFISHGMGMPSGFKRI